MKLELGQMLNWTMFCYKSDQLLSHLYDMNRMFWWSIYDNLQYAMLENLMDWQEVINET